MTGRRRRITGYPFMAATLFGGCVMLPAPASAQSNMTHAEAMVIAKRHAQACSAQQQVFLQAVGVHWRTLNHAASQDPKIAVDGELDRHAMRIRASTPQMLQFEISEITKRSAHRRTYGAPSGNLGRVQVAGDDLKACLLQQEQRRRGGGGTAATPAPRPAVRPPQPAPQITLQRIRTAGNGCITLTPGPSRWDGATEGPWSLEGTVILRNGCPRAQLTEARITAPPRPPSMSMLRPNWSGHMGGRRTWTPLPPSFEKLGFNALEDGRQAFIVPANGELRTLVRFAPGANQRFAQPPFIVPWEAVSCDHFVNGREHTIFLGNGPVDKYRCHPLPWPDESADVPSSYRPATRTAFAAQLAQACKPHRQALLGQAGAGGMAEVQAFERQLLGLNVAGTLSLRMAASRGPQSAENRYRICMADARIAQIQRKWLPTWEVR